MPKIDQIGYCHIHTIIYDVSSYSLEVRDGAQT